MILKKIYQNQMREIRRRYFDSFPFSLLWTEPNLNNHYHSSEFAFGSLRDEGIKRRGGAATSSLSEPKANSEERRQNIYFSFNVHRYLSRLQLPSIVPVQSFRGLCALYFILNLLYSLFPFFPSFLADYPSKYL